MEASDDPHERWVLEGVLAATLRLALVVMSAVSPGEASAAQPASVPPRLATVAESIRSDLSTLKATAGRSSTLVRDAAEVAALTALYAPARGWPLWLDDAGTPGRDAGDALTLLASAPEDGLRPADYQHARLARLALLLERSASSSADELATFDLLLSAGVLRYLRHLHTGRIDPRAVGFRMERGPERHDVVRVLGEALRTHSVPGTARTMAPPLQQYQALRTALDRYRALAAGPGPSIPSRPGLVREGDEFAGGRALREWLAALGDVLGERFDPSGAGRLDATLADGVRRFQHRHGLSPDGVLGPATRAALAVPMRWRVRQIELALERLRWLPDLDDRRLIALNVPMFRLWAWDQAPGGDPVLSMRTVVGRAMRTETPLFTSELGSVVFRPYWNVPQSILREELLPEIERDPEMLRRHDFEIVRGESDAGEVVAPTAASIAGLRQGTRRLRQRPGASNALGLVKFVFPNDAGVYLHGTPAPELFARVRRDFSHGCVRVDDPIGLAEWVLRAEPDWDRARILGAIQGGPPTRVELSRPVRVILFYTTAVVMPDDGTVYFSDDVYGHDTRLDRALVRAQSIPWTGSR